MKIAIVNSHLSRHIGGSQVQCDLIARSLATRGHDVHYIAVKGLGVGGTNVPYAVHEKEMSSIYIADACAAIRPDVVYWRFNKKVFYGAAKRISAAGIPIVFGVSHVADIAKWGSKQRLAQLRPKRFVSALRAKILARWNYRGFRFISGVVVNNPEHLNSLPVARQLHIDNSIAVSSLETPSTTTWPIPYCLWVANIKPQKHPEKFLELARSLVAEGVDFLMVGAVQSEQCRGVLDRRHWPPCFHYLGPRSHAEVQHLVQGALLVVHTCQPEGFPNIFIQAWQFGKPVVSLNFDPGSVIESERVGRYSRTQRQFHHDVRELIRNPDLRREMGDRGAALARRRFQLEGNVDRLVDFLKETVRCQNAQTARQPSRSRKAAEG